MITTGEEVEVRQYKRLTELIIMVSDRERASFLKCE